MAEGEPLVKYPDGMRMKGRHAFNYRGFGIEIFYCSKPGWYFVISDQYMNMYESPEQYPTQEEAIKEAKKVVNEAKKDGFDTVPLG